MKTKKLKLSDLKVNSKLSNVEKLNLLRGFAVDEPASEAYFSHEYLEYVERVIQGLARRKVSVTNTGASEF